MSSGNFFKQFIAWSLTDGWSKDAKIFNGWIRIDIYLLFVQNDLSSRSPSETLIKKSLSLSIC